MLLYENMERFKSFNIFIEGGAIMQLTDLETSWDPYLQYGQRQFYRQKEEIYRENEDGAEGFYYLLKGLIKISATIHTGESRIIDIVNAENPFGEQTADGAIYFSTASAIEDSVVYYFQYEKITPIMQEDPRFSKLFYQCLTDKLEVLSNNILFHTLSSEKVLACTLLLLSDKFVSEVIPFSQTELSCYTNLSRVTVYNTLKKWDVQVVSIQNKKIQIHNKEVLENIAAI